jgi:hypothetical protein
LEKIVKGFISREKSFGLVRQALVAELPDWSATDYYTVCHDVDEWLDILDEFWEKEIDVELFTSKASYLDETRPLSSAASEAVWKFVEYEDQRARVARRRARENLVKEAHRADHLSLRAVLRAAL